MRSSINIFKRKAGIFDRDKYIPIFEAIVNLLVSIILVEYIGLTGIFIGTAVSTIAFPLWIQSKIVYNELFNKSVKEYFKKYFIYSILTISIVYITAYICNLVIIPNAFISLIVKGIICIVITNIIYLILFFKTKEFEYIYIIFKNLLINKSNKLKKSKIA